MDYTKFIDNRTMDRIKTIHWFKNCGNENNDLFKSLSVPTLFVRSWDEALVNIESIEWENFTLEEKNRLTEFLSSKFQREYGFWNKLTDHYKIFLSEEVEPIIQNSKYCNDELMKNVRWDLLGALMQGSYKGLYKKTRLYMELLQIYEFGHIPCGVQGELPNEKLLIF